MPNYLTKEEIRQWRSSLERITLEEFAARLGKEVEESKPTNDVVDIVMSRGTSSNTSSNMKDGFSAIAARAFERERKISHTPFSINRKELVEKTEKIADKKDSKTEVKKKKVSVLDVIPVKKSSKGADKKKENVEKSLASTVKKIKSSIKTKTVLENVESLSPKATEVKIILRKPLTDREQLVFEYFLNNVGKTVFAKDLAALLDLPRDYVYKYIKNLRAKIEGEKLKNVPTGGFVLTE